MKLRHLNFEIGDLNFGIDFNFGNWEFWKKKSFYFGSRNLENK